MTYEWVFLGVLFSRIRLRVTVMVCRDYFDKTSLLEDPLCKVLCKGSVSTFQTAAISDDFVKTNTATLLTLSARQT